MGQYYVVCNLDKKEFLLPHTFGDGLKLMAFGCSGSGTMAALALLLSNGNGRGGGDHPSTSRLIGSWAGDRIVVAGDYGDPGKWIECVSDDELLEIAQQVFSKGYQKPEEVTLYALANQKWKDISNEMRDVMSEDAYLAENMTASIG